MRGKMIAWELKFMGKLRRIVSAGWVAGILIAFGPDMLRSTIEYGETLSMAYQAHGLTALAIIGICLVASVAVQLARFSTRGLPAIVREIYQAGYDDAQAVHRGREGGDNYRVRHDS